MDPNSKIPWQVLTIFTYYRQSIIRLYFIIQLRYVGQPEISQKATIVRSCYDIACTNNVVEFLSELGCRYSE